MNFFIRYKGLKVGDKYAIRRSLFGFICPEYYNFVNQTWDSKGTSDFLAQCWGTEKNALDAYERYTA